MSRPPTMQAPNEAVHNGGLIDFHESVLRADLSSALYAQAQAHAQAAAAAAQPPYGVGLQGPYGVPTVACAPYTQAAFPSLPAMGAPAMQAPPAACIAGPPSFVHLHGQMYKPVEPVQEGAGVAAEAGQTAPREPRAAPSAKAIDRMVEQRVEQRVNEFLAKTGKGKATGKAAGKKVRQERDAQELLRGLTQEMRRRI